MPDPHLDLDGLADLLAAGSTDGDAHLRSCGMCRSRLTELQAALSPVAASLAALPLPETPADLDGRFTTAVDRLRAAASKPARSRAAQPAPRKLAWLPIAGGLAAAAALVFGVVVVSNDNGSSSDGPGSSLAQPSSHTSNSGLDYAQDGKLLTAELPALLNGTAGTAQDAALPERTRRVGQKGVNEQAPQAAPGSAADPLSRLRSTAGLASCLTALTDGTEVELPLALDYASFEAKPALVVVLSSSKPEKVDVFVVGAGCAQADPQLLHFARLDAPA